MPIRARAARYRHLLLHRVTQRVERLTRVSPLFLEEKETFACYGSTVKGPVLTNCLLTTRYRAISSSPRTHSAMSLCNVDG